MSLSYWEIKSWLSDVDYCIVGSGITGLSCALDLRSRLPDSRIVVLEKGSLPSGASTKNAGFACFGSLTEIIADLKNHSEDELVELVASRYRGIAMLRERLGDRAMDYRTYGGHEVFPENGGELEAALEVLPGINSMLRPVFGQDPFVLLDNDFGMQGIHPTLVCNPLEGQLDPGRMMRALLMKAQEASVTLLNGVRLEGFEDTGSGVHVRTRDFEFSPRKLLLATNGFAGEHAGLPVVPARAQVLVTEEIPDLRLKGSFHFEEGYYYFRNIGNRVLIGGGRNLDREGETTTHYGETTLIQDRLEEILRTVILPGRNATVAQRWSGIMGIGPQKRPLLKRLSPNVSCGVRLGGMGVALGSHVGVSLAKLAAE